MWSLCLAHPSQSSPTKHSTCERGGEGEKSDSRHPLNVLVHPPDGVGNDRSYVWESVRPQFDRTALLRFFVGFQQRDCALASSPVRTQSFRTAQRTEMHRWVIWHPRPTPRDPVAPYSAMRARQKGKGGCHWRCQGRDNPSHSKPNQNESIRQTLKGPDCKRSTCTPCFALRTAESRWLLHTSWFHARQRTGANFWQSTCRLETAVPGQRGLSWTLAPHDKSLPTWVDYTPAAAPGLCLEILRNG